MAQEAPLRGLRCPKCGKDLKPPGGDNGSCDDLRRLYCPDCGVTFRTRPRNPGVEEAAAPSAVDPPPVGSLSLFWRGLALRAIELGYRTGVLAGSGLLLALGGCVPVVRGWLRDEINDWGDVLEALGGVRVVTEILDPDADLGPVLARADAPPLFNAVDGVARRLGVRPPGQIRLTYLPCCGVIAWGRSSRALILGLPLLRVLTLAELRAILAHELAHLARGDATGAARSARFVEALGRALDQAGDRPRGPLGAWARTCRRWSSRLIAPIARSQELRADRAAAAIAGGSAAASALVKVALVQPLFREVLEHYDPNLPDVPNLYAFFRTFWFRLSPETHTELRLTLLANGHATDDLTHPPLSDRIALVQSYPDPSTSNHQADAAPATTTLGDLEFLELVLHNRLFAVPKVEPTVFQKARA
jgi:Zn-dependent protease with chaperone function